MKVSSPEFTFDELTHTYKIKDRAVPSVTQVIKGLFGQYQRKDAQWFMERGSAVHLAIHLMVTGKLDWDTVDPQITGYLNAFQNFLVETKYQPFMSEIRMYDKKLMFAGTADMVLLDDHDELVLADFKSTITPVADLQLGGYSYLWHETHSQKIHHLCAIELSDSGKYSMRWVQDPKKVKRIFISCLEIYNWKILNN